MWICYHVVVEAVFFIDLEEPHVWNLFYTLEVEVTLYHIWLSDEEFKDDEEAYDAVAIKFQPFIVEFTASTRCRESLFNDVYAEKELLGDIFCTDFSWVNHTFQLFKCMK